MSSHGKDLSPREQQILDLIAAGHDTPAIVRELFLSDSTVKVHKANLYEKLGAHTAAQAVNNGYLSGYLRADAIDADVALVRHAHEMGYRIALVPQEAA